MADYVQLAPDTLLERIARTLKKDIGPAVDAAYPKTQAFMAAVVLQKLAGQLHELGEELSQLTASNAIPAPLAEALRTLRQDLDTASVSGLIETLYATRSELGERRFASLLSRVRIRLRARIDREMVYAA